MNEPASTKSPQEWTVAGVLEEIATINESMPDRSLAFVLGSGASVSSGIPTGKAMAEKWLNELCRRECHECRDDSDRDTWIASNALGIDDLTWDRAAEFYPRIFERRFRGDPEFGFAALEAAMDGKEPSLGYSLLAEIMQQTRHKVVVTTNFDNLVADALAIHAHKPPLIVGHESLAGYVRPALRRPLVAKIHRDLFLDPKNDTAGVGTLEQGWIEALTRLFKHYMALVIGYGGNDGSLMGFLNSLKSGDVTGWIIWCYHAGSPPSASVKSLLANHGGVMVAIPDFDTFMLRLAAKLIPDFDMQKISSRIEDLGKKRAANYLEQAKNLKIQEIVPAMASGVDQQAARQVLADAFKDPNDWLSWEMRARAEADPEKRNHIYLEGIATLPSSVELIGNYAHFLDDDRKDFDVAEAMYKRAMEADPKSAINLSNYAHFLHDNRKDFDAAEAMYKRALEADPKYAYALGNYALFLRNARKDFDRAEAMYKCALEADPKNAINLSNYALFLDDNRKDFDAAEAMYKRALEADPKNAIILSNYAIFLRNDRKDFDAAEAMYKRALEADPKNAHALGNYALFLDDDRKDFDAAEAMYKHALEADPKHANNLGNYALFLENDRKDFDAAEMMYKRALEADPKNAHALGGYALFLDDDRKDFDAAEAMYKRALEADPKHANNLGNYALFLRNDRKDFDAAEEMFKRALEADPKNANALGNYAFFLDDDCKDFDAAETMYKRALEADPKNANALGNYANFLENDRKDFDAAEAMYKRALEADSKDANNLGNYAGSLFAKGRMDEAISILDIAMELLDAKQPARINAECWMYAYCCAPLAYTNALTELKRLIGEFSIRTGEWDFSGVIAQAVEASHPESEWLPRLADVLADRASVKTLNAWAAWKAA